MNKQESVRISAGIGTLITAQNPVISYTADDVEKAKASYDAAELAEMRELGLLGEDFEAYFVIREFCERIGLGDAADGTYILKLFQNSRRLDADAFLRDPYLRTVSVTEKQIGRFLLTNAEYEHGEIFLYDMPDFTAPIVVPKIGFFNRRVRFPTLYEGSMPWISVCPSEVNSMEKESAAAHGRVLVLGLGLGYYPFRISAKPEVESITIIELQKTIIDIFCENLLPQFPERQKIRIVRGDAIAYLGSVRDGDYDFCFADIWEGVVDGVPLYEKIRPHEHRLFSTHFTYWIGDQLSYLSETEK